MEFNEAYVVGRSAEDALRSLREIILAEETEPIIDMYERAAWMSGATWAQTGEVSKQARLDRIELAALSVDIRDLTQRSNVTHNRLAAEVRILGQVNRIIEESR